MLTSYFYVYVDSKRDMLAEAIHQFRLKHFSAGGFCVFSSCVLITTYHLYRNNAYWFCCYLRGTKQERAAERDEQWEAQQNVLKRRRGNLWQDVSPQLHHLTRQSCLLSTCNFEAHKQPVSTSNECHALLGQ